MVAGEEFVARRRARTRGGKAPIERPVKTATSGSQGHLAPPERQYREEEEQTPSLSGSLLPLMSALGHSDAMNPSRQAAVPQSGDASISALASGLTRLKPSSFLILGLIRGGLQSGYAIRQAIGVLRMDVYWATTHAQIYPELARLQKAGYVLRRHDPHGGRNRSAYSLTEVGETIFREWLTNPEQPPMELRDEGLLRLGFADALSPEDALALITSLRLRAEQTEIEFRQEIIPRAEALEHAGLRFPAIVARMGSAYHQWAATYLAALADELSADPTLDHPPQG